MSVSFGVASADSHKGEDCTTAVVGSGGAPSCFGVFDGHTGKQASAICQSTVCQRLLTDSRGPPLPTAAIEDVFWAVDLEIGQRDLIDGTTATILWVESSPPEEAETPLREASSAPLREAPESGLRCVLAWVGDSTAVALDMRAAHGVPLAATRDHNPDSAEEQARMNRMQASRDDPASAAADDVKLFTRAFERAKAIAEQRPDGADSRRKCLFMNRSKPTESSHPFVVATEEHHAHPCYYDLQMTRSIGDWLAPDLVLPDPEFLELDTVVSGAFCRVILASDGLWDVCSHQTAAKVARKHETPQEAADALLAIAKRAYIKERGLERVGDDTSVVVVDLNPGLVPFEPPAAGATCCALL